MVYLRDNESEEMYLETILVLKEEQGNVKSIDVANKLGYAKSSVSYAIAQLSNKGYVYFDDFKNIILTKEGRKKACDVYDKHRYITALLMDIGASKEVAEENACRIEHVIDDELFNLIKKRYEK